MKVLCVIYVYIESEIQPYNIYTLDLKGLGFKINPYDRCVANKMVEWKQCNLVWYVDGNKLSHVDPIMVTNTRYFGVLEITRGG